MLREHSDVQRIKMTMRRSLLRRCDVWVDKTMLRRRLELLDSVFNELERCRCKDEEFAGLLDQLSQHLSDHD